MYEDMMNIELTHSHEEARFAYHCLHSRSESAEQQAVRGNTIHNHKLRT